MKQLLTRSIPIFASCVILFPSYAFAHTDIVAHQGFLIGFIHPFSGLDHLVAMISIGLWAAQMGGSASWKVPLSFVSVMAVSGLLSTFIAPLPFTESGITLSLLILGLLIAAMIRLPVAAGMLIAGIFAVFHGHAHVAELPQNISLLTYAAGFVTATALLHLFGIGVATRLEKYGEAKWLRVTGATVILCGCIA